MSILSLVRLGNGYTAGSISYGQASTCRPCHTYYITILVFVCPYVHTALENSFGLVAIFHNSAIITFSSIVLVVISSVLLLVCC